MFLKRAIVAAALPLVLLAARPAVAEIEQVEVRIDGLSCPFCAFNVGKRVKTLKGVERDAKIVTSVENGTSTFPWKAGVEFDPAAVRKAVRESGFTPRDVLVRATGTIELAGSNPTLRLKDEKAKLSVSVQAEERADRQGSWEALKSQAAQTKGKLRVRIEGVARSKGAGASWELVLHSWAPLEYGAEVVAEITGLTPATMRRLRKLDDVIHARAHPEKNHVHIWTKVASPDIAALRKRIEQLDLKVNKILDVDKVQAQGDTEEKMG